MIWIQAALIKNEGYLPIAQKVADVALENNFKTWVAIPSFLLDTPDPLTFDKTIQDTKALLRQNGFSGSQFYLIGQGLGSYVAQKYAAKNPNLFKA